MLSDLIQTPEFAAPLPRRLTAAALALGALLVVMLLILPARDHAAPATIVATAGR